MSTSGSVWRVIERIPLGRQASAAEIASIVVFLCSSASRYITGQAIVVDGGLLAV
jgi:3-oxoacyl-[acyl-carrier protein] reductase